jgi:hypothetical protein
MSFAHMPDTQWTVEEPKVRRREASVDQVLIRLLLHLGAGLQVGKAVR